MKIDKNLSFRGVVESCSLTVSMDGFAVTDGTWHQKQLQSPWSRIYYVLDGGGVFLCGDKEIPIEPGYVYFAPTGVTYGFEGRPSLEKLFFHVNLIMPDGYDLFSSENTRIVRFRRCREDVERLVSLYLSDDPVNHILLESELWKTVAMAATEMIEGDRYIVSYSKVVTAAIAYIRENLSAGLKVSAVADAVFCSVGNLNEHFCREIGTTVAKYIDGILMFEARRMLAEGTKTVGEVSSALGYCDQFYFSRCFTKHFSITPRDYKKLKVDG